MAGPLVVIGGDAARHVRGGRGAARRRRISRSSCSSAGSDVSYATCGIPYLVRGRGRRARTTSCTATPEDFLRERAHRGAHRRRGRRHRPRGAAGRDLADGDARPTARSSWRPARGRSCRTYRACDLPGVVSLRDLPSARGSRGGSSPPPRPRVGADRQRSDRRRDGRGRRSPWAARGHDRRVASARCCRRSARRAGRARRAGAGGGRRRRAHRRAGARASPAPAARWRSPSTAIAVPADLVVLGTGVAPELGPRPRGGVRDRRRRARSRSTAAGAPASRASGPRATAPSPTTACSTGPSGGRSPRPPTSQGRVVGPRRHRTPGPLRRRSRVVGLPLPRRLVRGHGHRRGDGRAPRASPPRVLTRARGATARATCPARATCW